MGYEMDEEDWREIVQVIQEELRESSQSDIADLSYYEEIREGAERRLPDAYTLADLMLNALHRDMSVRSSITVRQSLDQIGQLIDEGERPTEALVWMDPERSVIEGRERGERLDGDAPTPEAVEELHQLIGQLAENGPSRGRPSRGRE